MRNLKQLLGICKHVWEIESKKEVANKKEFNNRVMKKCIGLVYILKCNKCGKLKYMAY